jgi:hypothetical protein
MERNKRVGRREERGELAMPLNTLSVYNSTDCMAHPTAHDISSHKSIFNNIVTH